jgi:tetratricopeptide (TPR) repeat protein
MIREITKPANRGEVSAAGPHPLRNFGQRSYYQHPDLSKRKEYWSAGGVTMKRWFLCGFLLTLAVATAAASQDQGANPPLNKKELEAKAKELVSEGKALEKQGQLDEARDKYIDAEGYLTTKDALNGIDRILDAKKQQAEALLKDAHHDCDAGKMQDCAAKLEKALVVAPEKTVVLHYNLALCYQKLGDRSQALEHLDSVIAATRDTKERVALLELHTQFLLGAALPPNLSGDLAKSIEAFNQADVRIERDPGVATALCDQIKDLPASTSPAIVFDQAKCAEEDARDADAARLLGEYLKLAPNALDASEVLRHQDGLLSLASMEGDSGARVRPHFAAAGLALDYRRYDRAIAEYRSAEQIAPAFPLIPWRLALLYEASGDVAQARDCFEKYIQLETDADRKGEAQAHLDALALWRSSYDDNVDEAHELLGDLLRRAMGLSSEGVKHTARLNKHQTKISGRYRTTLSASEAISAPYVRRQMSRAREDLDQAIQLFPIGPEANQMLALIDLEDNDWPSAFNSYDAVASAGQPASFYAQMNSSRENKIVLATKVEVGKEAVRFVYLSSYNAKKKLSEPPETSAGDDDLGNLFTSVELPPDPQAQTLVVPMADLEGVRTDKSFVIIKLHKEQITLAPVYMVSYTPVEGRVARELGNEYTRMFVRYLGYEQARLGKEGMTFGEKMNLGYTFMQTGMDFFDTVATGGINSYEALQGSLKLAHALRTDVSNLRRNMAAQRHALVGLEFKPIPNQPAQLKYRDHL